jgi:MFS family permease
VVGGSLTALASLPLVLFVRETREKAASSHHRQTSRFLRGVPSTSLRAVGVLMSGQILFNLTASGAQPLAALKLLELAPREAGATTLAFGLAGGAMAIASVTSSTLTGRTGYRPVIAGAAALIAVGLLATASASTTIPAVLAFGTTGFMSGLLAPAIASMVGLEAPAPARGALFGMSSSALGVGLVLGPLFAGVVAAVSSVSTALVALALVSVGLAALLGACAREPGGWRSDSLGAGPDSETTKLPGTTCPNRRSC